MVKKLSKLEIESQRELERNMVSRLAEFKNEMNNKSENARQKELFSLKEYVEGCYRSEIDDTLINIRFCEGKIIILESMI